MKTAFLYAGQGSQHPGMGADLYEAYPEFRAVLDSAEVGFDLKTVSFTDPDGVLNQTEYTQPCMVAFAAGMTAILAGKGIRPDYAAGLSLGEYSALCAAGVFTAKQAVELAAFRGRAMAAAAAGVPCGMTAVLGLDREKLLEACQRAADAGVVEIANYNCPGQIVITGWKESVEKASQALKEAGAKRVMPLNVSGPFHSPMLTEAGEELGKVLENVELSPLQIPYVTNVTAEYVSDISQTKALLAKQVASSVRWQQSVENMIAAGVDTFVEIGPGRTLAGFMRKINRDVKVYNIGTWEDVDKVVSELC